MGRKLTLSGSRITSRVRSSFAGRHCLAYRVLPSAKPTLHPEVDWSLLATREPTVISPQFFTQRVRNPSPQIFRALGSREAGPPVQREHAVAVEVGLPEPPGAPIVPPVNIQPNPTTKIGSLKWAALFFFYPKKWDPMGFGNHGHTSFSTNRIGSHAVATKHVWP